MLKQSTQKKVFRNPLIGIVFVCLAVFGLAACGGVSNTPGSTPTASATSTSSPTQMPFKVTGVDLVVNPNSIAGKVCESSASFTYTVTFHIPANTAGGAIQFINSEAEQAIVVWSFRHSLRLPRN